MSSTKCDASTKHDALLHGQYQEEQHDLVAPGKPTDHTCNDLKQLVKLYHNPKPLVIVRKFKFNTCVR